MLSPVGAGHIYPIREFHSHGGTPLSLDGLVQGKSQCKVDDLRVPPASRLKVGSFDVQNISDTDGPSLLEWEIQSLTAFWGCGVACRIHVAYIIYIYIYT